MDEKRLEKVSLCCCLLGILLLILFHFHVQDGDVENLYPGKKVLFTGKVVSVDKHAGMTSFSVQHQGEYIRVAAFTTNLSLDYGDYVKVAATVDDAETLDVIAERIEYIR